MSEKLTVQAESQLAKSQWEYAVSSQ